MRYTCVKGREVKFVYTYVWGAESYEMCTYMFALDFFQPQNILLTHPFPKGDIKLCDLGFACLVNTGEDIRDIIGTVDYVGKNDQIID